MSKSVPQYGVFFNDIPYVCWGSGRKKMLILAGGPGNSVPPPFVIQGFYKEYDPFCADYTIYLVTRRKGQPEGFSTRDMSDDYATMVEHDFGGHVEVIIGTSMGGMIAQHFAADHAGLVDRLVIAIAAHKVSDVGKQIDLKYARYLSRGKARRALLVIANALYPPGFTRLIYKFLFWLVGAPLLGEQHATYRQDVMVEARAELEHDSLEALARIQIPVLIICGDQDIYFPREYYEEMAALIKGSTLKMYTGKGHMNTLGDEAFVKDMQAFIGNEN
jgi:pimeloyl-ACP methyl ester carboxylesterase